VPVPVVVHATGKIELNKKSSCKDFDECIAQSSASVRACHEHVRQKYDQP
jgi:hypothetical protein